jgi:hypothetical protein
MGTELLRYELERYLDWPGQTPFDTWRMASTPRIASINASGASTSESWAAWGTSWNWTRPADRGAFRHGMIRR